MTSILTNTAATAAVSALCATQRSLARVQQQVTSGLKVGGAQDGAAYWSIATAMRSRIGTLQAVNEGLALTASIIGVTTSALDAVRSDVDDIRRLAISAQTAGVDKTVIQAGIALKQKDIVTVAEAADFHGVNWLVARISGTDAVREDDVLGGPRSAYSPYTSNPAVAQYTDRSSVVDTRTAALTLGSTTATTTVTTLDTVSTPDPTNTYDVVDRTTSSTASGDATGYQNVDILFSPESATTINLHPLELFKSFVGTTIASGSVSYSDTPAAALPTSSHTGAKISPYLDATMDDLLDTPIVTPSQILVLSTVLNLDVATTPSQDQQYLLAGLKNALSAIVSGQAFLGGLANRVSGQQAFNGAMIDALTSGVGSLVDADMDGTSARLVALQTQQQLGLQALSIANDDTKLVIRLFEEG